MISKVCLVALLSLLLIGCNSETLKPPPTQADRDFSEEDATEARAIGSWKVTQEDGQEDGQKSETVYYIVLYPDGTSWQSISATEDKTGTWKAVGSNVVIGWDDGWMDTIDFATDELEKKSFSPETKPASKPTHVGKLEKVENLPADLMPKTQPLSTEASYSGRGSRERGVRISTPVLVTRTVSSRRTPPTPGT